MASYSFKLPDIGEGIAEAEIVAWHVRPGDRVEEDAPLCDMMTDKATVEMTAPVSGTVTKVAGEVGDMVAIGAVLAEFETEGGADAEPTVQVAPNEAAQVALVRHRPEELSPLVGEERNPAGQPPGLTYEMPGASRTGSLERGSERSEPKNYLPAGASSPAGQTPLPSPPPQGGRGRKILASPAVRDPRAKSRHRSRTGEGGRRSRAPCRSRRVPDL